MGFITKLFKKKQPTTPPDEHALIVHFSYGSDNLQPIFDIGHQLEAALNETNAGDFDGNEIATDCSDGFLYIYGPDGDRLFETATPILEAHEFMKGAQITLRYGPPADGVKRHVFTLGA